MPVEPSRATNQEIADLLYDAGTGFADRLDRLSARLLERPYLSFPLVGGPELAERPVDHLRGFDCVTYVETVLALARARSPADFRGQLLDLRYHRGHVSWRTRNHYMTLWLDRNGAEGRIRVLHGPEWVQESTPRTLHRLDGYPPVSCLLRYLPVDRMDEGMVRARGGDVILFVSTFSDLDTFHLGLLFHRGGLQLRHAARSRGSVLEEPLSEFVDRNALRGVILARPLEPGALPCPSSPLFCTPPPAAPLSPSSSA